MNKLYGNHVGIVVQNDDPEMAGKVKIYIPQLTPSVYKKWIEKKTNKKYKFIGANIDALLTNGEKVDDIDGITSILHELKQILPWAQCAAPLTSENASGRFNALPSLAHTTDSNFSSGFNTPLSANESHAPAHFYEKEENRLTDSFPTNPWSGFYVPEKMSNMPTGMFGVPRVGSHVWVFFIDGNVHFPVYFAAAYGKTDWNAIYSKQDYPGSFENNQTGSATNDNATYRNKFVINQKGATISINNTDLQESIKITHYSGSFKEYNNIVTTELNTGNKQSLTVGDVFSSVKGSTNLSTDKNYSLLIGRDRSTRIGKVDRALMQKWKDLYAPIQDNKQLFEIKRAEPANLLDSDGNILLKRSSVLQTKAGAPSQHPAINQSNYSLDDSVADLNTLLRSPATITSSSIGDGPSRVAVPSTLPKAAQYPPVNRYTSQSGIVWTNGVGLSTSSQDGTWERDVQKDQIGDLVKEVLPQLLEVEKQLGAGGNEIVEVARHKVETIGTCFNDYGSIRLDRVGKMLNSGVLIDDFGPYTEYTPAPLVELVHVQDLPGGDYTLQVCNRMNITVGAGGISIKSVGLTQVSGSITNISGQQVNIGGEHELNLAANTINIAANTLRLTPGDQQQVYVDGSLGVEHNVAVAGGMSVEGEMFVQHITGPMEFQCTEKTTVFGTIIPDIEIEAEIEIPTITSGLFAGGAPVQGGLLRCPVRIVFKTSPDNIIKSVPHSHLFKNIAMTLHDRNVQVRSDAKELNKKASRVLPSRRFHGLK